MGRAAGRQTGEVQAAPDYLQRILTARVYDLAVETPLDHAKALSQRLGADLWLKREDLQPVHSFKLRGAYNRMALLSPAELERGVICASAGNHAQGVAMSAQHLGCRAVIVMPRTTPKVKIDAVASHGAEIVLHGDSYSDAAELAESLRVEHGYTFVHPFDDPDVIAGQGTIGMEILRQHRGELDAIFVPVGGGGLIAGIGAYVKAIMPTVRIIGVQTFDSAAMAESLRLGDRVELSDVGLFSDGTAVRRVGEETFRIARAVVDDIVLVDTDAVCAAINDVFGDTRAILEPAGALAVAGAKQFVETHGRGGRYVAVTSGANMNFGRLRFVADRSEEHEAIFAITIPERRGSFREFAERLGDRAVTEFNYRISGTDDAVVFVGITVTGPEDAAAFERRFIDAGFATLNLTHDALATEHIRHMVGGPSPLARDERLFRMLFPERPGALGRFLSGMRSDWNISLFHYRNQGSDYGRVLIGLQVPPGDNEAFDEYLASVNYPATEETDHPAYRLFLRHSD
ncbi:MAG: threonine ammonia-lyase, biosynthetic [Actinobacteria bacterium]|nr:threonine ammonia-lyase, biosynthetic [Actinomycetota bacterium]